MPLYVVVDGGPLAVKRWQCWRVCVDSGHERCRNELWCSCIRTEAGALASLVSEHVHRGACERATGLRERSASRGYRAPAWEPVAPVWEPVLSHSVWIDPDEVGIQE